MRKLFTTINAIRLLSTVIMGIAAYVSYGTQRHVLESWGVEADAAALIPLTIDVLAMIANLAIHAHGVDRSGRRVAMLVLVFTGTVSMAANAFAGVTWGSRIAHVWCVAAYLLAEWVAAKVKAAKVTAPAPMATLAVVSHPLATPVEQHPVAAVEQLEAAGVPAPVSPAPAGSAMRIGAFGLPTAKPLPPARRDVRAVRVLSQPAA